MSPKKYHATMQTGNVSRCHPRGDDAHLAAIVLLFDRLAALARARREVGELHPGISADIGRAIRRLLDAAIDRAQTIPSTCPLRGRLLCELSALRTAARP